MGPVASVATAVMKTASYKERRKIAEMIGLVANNAMFDQALESRLNADSVSGGFAKVMSKFFQQTLLQPLTNVQRIWMLHTANTFIYEQANLYLHGNATDQALGQRELLALGLKEGQLKDFAQFMYDNDGAMPTPEQLVAKNSLKSSDLGSMYAIATTTLVSEIIQNPQKTDRPDLASHPIARMSYGILSFLYAFFSNVTIGVAKEAHERAKIAGNMEYVKAAGYWTATFAGLFAAHLLVTVGREFLRNGDKWDEWEEEDELLERLVAKAASRTGILGPIDHVVQMIGAVRYQVDLSNGLAGAQAGYFLRHATKIFASILNDSPNTQTAERNLVASLYNGLLLPISAGAYAFVGPANVATNALLYPIYQSFNNYKVGRELGADFFPEEEKGTEWWRE